MLSRGCLEISFMPGFFHSISTKKRDNGSYSKSERHTDWWILIHYITHLALTSVHCTVYSIPNMKFFLRSAKFLLFALEKRKVFTFRAGIANEHTMIGLFAFTLNIVSNRVSEPGYLAGDGAVTLARLRPKL